LLKFWFAYPFFVVLVFLISVCNDRAFDTGAGDVAYGSVEDHLE